MAPQLFAKQSATDLLNQGIPAVCEMLYPMYVTRVQDFLRLPRILPHDELLSRGALVKRQLGGSCGGKVIMVSHQWLSFSAPDPENEHFQALCELLKRFIRGDITKVDVWWLHKTVLQSKTVECNKKAALCTNDTVWSEVNLWMDYMSMPQVGPTSSHKALRDAAKAVQSIPAYVEQCDLMVVVAPVSSHQDTGELCNFSSWRARGWCRAELVCSVLARHHIHALVCTGGKSTPFLMHPCEAHRLVVGTGEFSCCKMGHQVNGVPMACDKEKVAQVLDRMLKAKVVFSRQERILVDQHFYLSMRGTLLQGLPMPLQLDDSTEAPAPSGAAETIPRSCTAARLVAKLGWGPADDVFAQQTGFTLVLCAALHDDPEAIEALTSEKGGRRHETNVVLKEQIDHLSYFFKGAGPLHISMAHSSWPTCRALIDGGAVPHCAMANGMDPLFTGCCKGNLPNVTAWLQHFPGWLCDRVEPGMGLNALNLSALVGVAEVGPIIRLMMDAKASANNVEFWGGQSSLLCCLAQNENANCDAARLLLQEGHDVNARFRPQNRTWKMMLQVMRLAAKVDNSTCTRAFANLEGSTPLHFAAKRGDVALASLLVAHGADVGAKNKQGRTALDVAVHFFGGNPPKLLQAALIPGKVAPAALPALLGSTDPKLLEETGPMKQPTHSMPKTHAMEHTA